MRYSLVVPVYRNAGSIPDLVDAIGGIAAQLDAPVDIPATNAPWIEQLAEDHAVTTRRLFRA